MAAWLDLTPAWMQLAIFVLGLIVTAIAFFFVLEVWRTFRQWSRYRQVRQNRDELLTTRALMDVERKERALKSVAEWKRR